MNTIDPARPVAGRTVVVTRPAAQASTLLALLSERGYETIAFPVIAIEALTDTRALDATMSGIERYRLVVFVSPNAIDHALVRRTAPWPTGVAIGAMGPGSVAALRARGIAAPAIRVIAPRDAGDESRYDSEALFEALDLASLTGGRVLIVRGNGGRAWLAERLSSAGIAVDEIESYRRTLPQAGVAARAALRALLASDAAPTFIVTSSEGLQNLVTMIAAIIAGPERDDSPRAGAWSHRCRLVVPHARIAENARGLGFSDVVLSGPGDANIAATLE